MQIVGLENTARAAIATPGGRRGVSFVATLAAALIAASSAGCGWEAPPLVDSTSGALAVDSVAPPSVAPPVDSFVPPVDHGVVADAPPTPAPVPIDTTGAAIADADLRVLAAQLIVPVQGIRPEELNDTFTAPRGGGSRSHEALDILAPRGTPVLSATDGVLRKFHDSAAGGLMVYAGDATDRFVLMYGHLDRYADGLVEGQPLRRGQVIGYVGTTGNAPAGTPHLHFAIARGQPSVAWWRGTPVDPYPLLTGKTAAVARR
jgi:murein DD-endopeptidase MepM/ murein hydrolase activator NlpD